MIKKSLSCILIAFFCCNILNAQISSGGYPDRFSFPNKQYSVKKNDNSANYDSINMFLETRCTQGCRLHVGCEIPSSIKSNEEQGIWHKKDNGKYTYYITYHLKEAKAIGISFSYIKLPEGSKMFVHNASKSYILGAYTNKNIYADGKFSIEPIAGEFITLEFNDLPEKNIHYVIDGFSYMFDFSMIATGFGTSGECEVNVNCQEGINYRNAANAVIRLLLLDRGSWFYCSGSLINNSLLDKTPYFLTADHCAETASAIEMERWIFYFLYESDGCANPETEPQHKTMVGCTKIASAPYYNSSTGVGSDFLLVKFIDDVIPDSYSPNFAGWDISGTAEESANCIHHPSGDIKKISYTDKITSNCFFIENYHIETHWKVIWSETISGHGVTEGGSSGAPLFNEKQQIVGTLTGGDASCSFPNGPDYFGKMSFSWNQNGSKPNQRLDCWLDPKNSGVTSLNGYTDIATISRLEVEYNNIKLNSLPNITKGKSLYFRASFSQPVDSSFWTFNAATPSSATTYSDESIKVTYDTLGYHDIIVTWYVNGQSYTRSFNNYVSVKAGLYPNPFSNQITLITDGNFDRNSIEIKLLGMNGRIAAEPAKITVIDNVIKATFPEISDGNYILYTKFNNLVNTYHVIKR